MAPAHRKPPSVVTLLTAAAILALTAALTFAVGRAAGTHISLGLVAAGATGVWALAAFTAGIAALAAGGVRGSIRVTGLAMGLLIGMYALDLAGRLAHGLSWVRWASVFRYYGAPLRDGIDVAAGAAIVVAGLICLMAGTVLFERRDIRH